MDLVEANGLPQHRHPWELARAGFFNRIILGAVGGKPARVLDVGCGDAWFVRQLIPRLAPSSTAIGWDIALTDGLLAVYRAELPVGVELTRDEPSGWFDLILCMDVIEHVPDDVRFLSNLCDRFLRPGGRLLCTVPAWPSLFSTHDVQLRHFRRYTPAMGVQALIASGLRVHRKGGLFHGLAAVRGLGVARGTRAVPLADPLAAPETDGSIGLASWSAPMPVTRFVTGVLKAEGLLSRAASALRIELPGLSWWALCEKA